MNRFDPPSSSAVPKIRLRYAKRGRLRFASHRDVARAFERALRRAAVPMAYSQGFSPHPKISWLGAAPAGAASEAEYVELQLVRPTSPEQVLTDLRAVLIPGLDVLEAVEAGPAALAEQLEASWWRIHLPTVPVDQLGVAVHALVAADSVQVQRMTKKGIRDFDARAALVDAQVREGAGRGRGDDRATSWEPYGILDVVVRQTTPTVRPDDVLNALCVVADLALPAATTAVRLQQGRLDDEGGLVDPLARDRAAAGARRGESLGEARRSARAPSNPPCDFLDDTSGAEGNQRIAVTEGGGGRRTQVLLSGRVRPRMRPGVEELDVEHEHTRWRLQRVIADT